MYVHIYNKKNIQLVEFILQHDSKNQIEIPAAEHEGDDRACFFLFFCFGCFWLFYVISLRVAGEGKRKCFKQVCLH